MMTEDSHSPSDSGLTYHELGPANEADSVVSSTRDAAHTTVDGNGQVIQRHCVICNDLASGFHYGVWSCEGCKAFFKRSLQGPVDYMCPATNNCTIDKHRRKSCQACRFRKCLEVGMMKRRERRSTKKLKGKPSPEEKKCRSSKKLKLDDGEQKKVNISPDSSPNLTVWKTEEEEHPGSPQSCATSLKSSSYCTPSTSSTLLAKVSAQPENPQPYEFSNHASIKTYLNKKWDRNEPMPPHPLTLKLEQIDLPVKTVGQAFQEVETEYSVLHKMISLADMELVDVVNWAKALPGFSELDISDRILLLETCWMEILCVGAAWRSRISQVFQINFATDLILTEEMANIAKMMPIVGDIWQISRQMLHFQLTSHEMLLLRAVVLLNSEVTDFSGMNKLSKLKGEYLEALHYECARTLGDSEQSSSQRMAHLLCILPFTRQVSFKAITHLFHLHNRESVPVGDLVAEMLAAQKEYISPSPL